MKLKHMRPGDAFEFDGKLGVVVEVTEADVKVCVAGRRARWSTDTDATPVAFVPCVKVTDPHVRKFVVRALLPLLGCGGRLRRKCGDRECVAVSHLYLQRD